jgi:ubiquitin-protein ligase
MAASSQASKCAKRVTVELKKLQTSPIPGVSIGPVGDDLLNWAGTIQGPAGSFYEGGVFKITLSIPAKYPFEAPIPRIVTPIYHPGVDAEGLVCMKAILGFASVNGEWAATFDLRTVLVGIGELLKNPKKVGDPLSPEKGIELMEHPDQFAHNARAFTRQHARG